MQNTVLVTGCAGFIGFHTASELLKKGHTVVGVDNLNVYYDVSLKLDRLNILKEHTNFHFYKQDIADLAGMKSIWGHHKQISKVVHLAAQAGVRHSILQPFDYLHSNIQGHLVLLELCRLHSIQHFVYASSSSVYGKNEKMPFSVKDKTESPISLYGASKKADELMTESYVHLYNLPATGLRFFTVYGPWGRPDMAAFLFAEAIANNRPIKLFNNGDMKRDFTYIDDIVAGIIQALGIKRAPGEHKIYNLGNNKTVELKTFVDVLETAMGIKAKKELLPMQDGDVKETYADITESIEDLGFNPEITIEQGLPIFIDWFKSRYAPDSAAA